MTDLDEVGTIKHVRELKKMGINELSRNSEVPAGYISDIERGKKNNPSISITNKLKGALGFSEDEARKIMQKVGQKDQDSHQGLAIEQYVDELFHQGLNKRFVINKEAETVKFIFQSVAAEYGYKKIVRMLQDKGAKTKSGKNFTTSALNSILTNEKYTGLYIFNQSKRRKKWGAPKSEKDMTQNPLRYAENY